MDSSIAELHPPHHLWLDSNNATVSETCIDWQEYTISDSTTEPSWRTDTIPFIDGEIRWQEDTALRSATSRT